MLMQRKHDENPRGVGAESLGRLDRDDLVRSAVSQFFLESFGQNNRVTYLAGSKKPEPDGVTAARYDWTAILDAVVEAYLSLVKGPAAYDA